VKFGEEFKDLRKKIGITQEKLSEKTKIPRRTIQDWEKTRSEPHEYVKN